MNTAARAMCFCAFVFLFFGTSLATADEKLDIEVIATSAFHSMDNADLRSLDESSDRAIIDSDDQRQFGHSDMQLRLKYRVNPNLTTYSNFKYDLIWRDDQAGRAIGSRGNISVFTLFFEHRLWSSDNGEAVFAMGRQPFSIGAVPRDYILGGTADAATLRLSGNWGQLRVLGLDFFGGNNLPETGYRYFNEGRETTYNLRGETNTLRTGAVYEWLPKGDEALPLTLKAYYFYASVGGGPIEASGADVTYGGAIGNYRDADYQHLMGARARYDHRFKASHELSFYGEYAQSMGIDRKPTTERDVKTDGAGYGGGINYVLSGPFRTSLNAEFYHFDGARYGAVDALEFNRGFVGFKGERIGGNTLGRYLAWRPSSHLDAFGVVHTPQDQSRSAGTAFVHAQLSLGYGKVDVRGSWWLMMDTGKSFAAENQFASLIDPPPFGRTLAEFQAQDRMGKTLGQAMDLQLKYTVDANLSFLVDFGVFLPDEFYAIQVDRLAGETRAMLGGEAPFWVGRAGAVVTF